MKKFFLYILIAVMFYGPLGFVRLSFAADPVGTCRVEKTDGSGFDIINTTQADCGQRGGSWAAGVGYNLLSPLPCDTSIGTDCSGNQLSSFDPTGANKIGEYLNVMFRIFLGICAVLAVIMIVLGGVEYMTSELISSKEQGKERILHAVFGLLLALGAYLILNTINPNILKTEINLPDATVTVDLESDVPQTAVAGKYSDGTAVGANWEAIAGPPTSLPAGVTTNKPECLVVGNQNCTSIRGLSPSTINNIVANCSSCTSLVITGGTEFWMHGGRSGSTTHRPNSATIDLRTAPELTNYIMGGPTVPVLMKRYERNGISYLYEGNHWHAGR